MLDISSHHSKHFSQSQHAASQCLRLHYYVKVKALKRPQAAFFVTGSHIHAGYEGIYKQIAFDSLHNNHPEYKKHIDIITKHTTDSKSNTKLAAANAYLKEFERTSEVEFDNAIWPNPTKKFNPRINKDIWIPYAHKTTRAYVAHHCDGFFQPLCHDSIIWVENMIKVPFGNCQIWMKLDLVTANGFIVDHKTSSSKPNEDELRLGYQAHYYAWGFYHIFNRLPEGVIFDYTLLGMVPSFYTAPTIKITQIGIERIKEDVESQLRLIDFCHERTNTLKEKAWPRNRNCCVNYGHTCEYLDVCQPEEVPVTFGF